MRKCGNILRGAKRYSRPRGFNIAGVSAPVAPAVPTPLFAAAARAAPGTDGQTDRRTDTAPL